MSEDELAHLFSMLGQLIIGEREPIIRQDEFYLMGYNSGIFMEDMFSSYSDLIYNNRDVTLPELHAFCIGYSMGQKEINVKQHNKTEH